MKYVSIHFSVKAGCVGSRFSTPWYVVPSAELEGGNCGHLKHVSEAAVPSVPLLLSFRHCHLPCAALVQTAVGAFLRDDVSQLLTWQKSITVHNTTLHLATVARNIFTSMEILFEPVPYTPVLVNMCSPKHTSLLAKNFLPAVGEGSVTQAA